MKSGANLYFGSGHALDDVARNYKHPSTTKHPSYHEGVVSQLLKRASKIIRCGQRVVPETKPVEQLERKRLRNNIIQSERRRREGSFMKVAVRREQDSVDWAEEDALLAREAQGLEPVFLNKAARKEKLKELTRARLNT